ncbi:MULTISPECIES: hypothetical protein [unclassified Variovorax]|nr:MULTISPECIES: hypothetical protein [unclassified Variovorax]PNG50202.1 hypothetical protein CHC06_05825 [Variovorax sp. B2]PNG51075.1 hypothetical protein CHC07_05731 [Variovorax sp. B4]VTV17259.1 hypothetical protein WDL1P1_00243 [Variovorax sp. WDL1]VTU42320.1 hypothetical protein SRS16P1_00240 [Variovorax sp. SRS16]VTU42346.1 hypothetical protein E5P1_00238 [Variovorax sp. PBL-E5]
MQLHSSTETLAPAAQAVAASPPDTQAPDVGGAARAGVTPTVVRPALKKPYLPPFDVLMKMDLDMHQRRGGGSGRNNLLRDLGKRARYIQSMHQEAFLPTWREHQTRSYKRNFPSVFGLDYLAEWWLDGDLWVGQYARPELQNAAAKQFFLALPLAYLNEGGEELMARDVEARDFSHVATVIACLEKLKRPLRSMRIPADFAFPPGYVKALEKRKALASAREPVAIAAPARAKTLSSALAAALALNNKDKPCGIPAAPPGKT